MAKQRKQPTKQAGWMLAVMFNSLLILLPVIASNTVKKAYAGVGVAEQPTIDAIMQTRTRMDLEFEALSPNGSDAKLPFWQDKVQLALEDEDIDAMRGYLLAAPQMLGNDLGEQVEARAEAESKGTADERLIRAALQKIPESVARAIEFEVGMTQPQPEPAAPAPETTSELSSRPEAAADPAADAASGTALAVVTPPPGEEIGQVLQAGARTQMDWRFELLGSYGDLAGMSQRWVGGDRADSIVFKLTGIGLVEQGMSDGLSDANIRAVSIVKSASRSNRLTPSFRAYLETLASNAAPEGVLVPALEAALSPLATTEVRGERVLAAFEKSIDPAGLTRLETDLEQIDKIAGLTSPSATLMLLSVVEDGTDLRRARMLAEAGGVKAVTLVKERGNAALRVADAGVRWDSTMVLEIMSLTAAGLLLFWVALSTVNIYVRMPQPKAQPLGMAP